MGVGVVEGDGAGYFGEFEDLGETARRLEDRVTCSGCECTTVAEEEEAVDNVDDMPFVGDDVDDDEEGDDERGGGDALVAGIGDGDDGGSGA